MAGFTAPHAREREPEQVLTEAIGRLGGAVATVHRMPSPDPPEELHTTTTRADERLQRRVSGIAACVGGHRKLAASA